MASVPSPIPDYGPVDSPQPSQAPTELPPMPDDFDQPAPMNEPTPDGPGQFA